MELVSRFTIGVHALDDISIYVKMNLPVLFLSHFRERLIHAYE